MENNYSQNPPAKGSEHSIYRAPVRAWFVWCVVLFITAFQYLFPLAVDEMPDNLWWALIVGVTAPKRKPRTAGKHLKPVEAKQAESLGEKVVAASQSAMVVTDAQGRIVEWGTSAQRMFGWSGTEVVGVSLGSVLLRGIAERNASPELCLDMSRGNEQQLRDKTGKLITADIHILEQHEGRCGILIHDVTHSRMEERKLRKELGFQRAISHIYELSTLTFPFEEIMHRVLDTILSSPWVSKQTSGAIFIADDNSMLMLVEHGVSDAVKDNCFEVKSGQCLCGVAAKEKRLIYASYDDPRHSIPHPDIKPHGHYCVPIMSEDTVKGLVVLYLDPGHECDTDEALFLETVSNALGYIIRKYEYEQERQHSANFDQLTSLPNRKVMAERINLANSKYARDPNRLYAVLFLDLNRFKNINDTLGHAAGDQVLMEFSRRIADELRCSDSVGRLGGDEFVVLLEEAKSFSSICHVAERLHEVTRAPIGINGYDISVSMSVGIAFCDSHYQNFEEILRDADTAMYQAKTLNGSATIIFDEAMRNRTWSFLEMETKLRRALVDGELSVSYQPVYSHRDRRFIGAEALVRWERSDGKLVTPTEFVPVAEESGLIFEMGEYVLRQACQLVTQLHADGLEDFYISVNVSAKQILNRAFVDMLDTILSDTQVNTRHLHLEITESVFAGDLEHVNRQLTEIKRRGIKLLIDDFGTGYSSLSYLSNFPFDALKVDKSFVSEIGRDGGTTMVQTIVDLAVNLGMDIVVEGVETEEQLSYILELGCHLMQGYYFAHPQGREEFRKMMIRII